ncbi:MAG: hypothetical protein NEHIOOID_00970 [Holosporales bacterium]
MFLFDDDFYKKRDALWAIMSEDFLSIMTHWHALIKAHDDAFSSAFGDFFEHAYQKEKSAHYKSLFTQKIDEKHRDSCLNQALSYVERQIPSSIFMEHCFLLKSFFLSYIDEKIPQKMQRDAYRVITAILEFDSRLGLLSFDQQRYVAAPQYAKGEISSILDQNLEKVLGRLSDFSLTLKDHSVEINKSILTIAAQTRDVTQTSASITDKVSSVSMATQQLSLAINEIAKQIYKTATISQKSKDQAKTAESIVSDLKKAVSRIDEVVLLISEIANQTNLLALNATIESARSGNAGKGFAVVASEVKKLATQTSQATEEIKQKIREIQNHTDHVVEAIGDMNDTILDINQTTVIISSAVEEQSATTQEIFKTIADLVNGFQKLTTNLSSINEVSTHAEGDASKILMLTQNVTSNTQTIKKIVKRFVENAPV